MVRSLLCLAFSKTDITLKNLSTKFSDRVYKDIYDKVVNEMKNDIRKILNNHQAKLVLKYVKFINTSERLDLEYVVKGLFGTVNAIPLWHIAIFLGIWVVIMKPEIEDRIKHLQSYFEHDNYTEEECKIVSILQEDILKLEKSKYPDDINQYIDFHLKLFRMIK